MSEKTVCDHLRRTVQFAFPPKRMISLCPSITETLFDLGLADRIVGRTRYCIHPEELVGNVQTIGGTKKVKETIIDKLCPDLIIAEKEENPKEIVEKLSEKYPVFTVDVKTYEDGLEMINDLGEITDRAERASEMADAIKDKFRNVSGGKSRKVAYVIWQNPYMVAGNNTYIHSILEKAGFCNAFMGQTERYPAVSLEALRSASLDAVFLATEPFPFQDSHREELQSQLPGTKVMLVDGEICWYGSRMLKTADELIRLQKVI